MSDLDRLADARSRYDRRAGIRSRIESELKRFKGELKKLRVIRSAQVQAQVVIQTVAQSTQEELQYHISELATLALVAVFPDDPYRLQVSFVLRRGKTEADITFCDEQDNEVDPTDGAGGGAAQVAAFALRAALWSLTSGIRPIFMLDEPFHFVSIDRQERTSQMLREVSDKLHLQSIVVSHKPELIAHANRTFTVKKKKGATVLCH